MDDFTGKIALVTGGAKRLGRAIAVALGQRGASVLVHYNQSAADAEALCRELQSTHGVKAWAVPADLAQAAESDALVGRCLQVAGRLDLVVNNASIFPADRLEDVTFESLTENLAVNAWAPLAVMRAFAAAGGNGAVVNLLDSRIRGYDWNHTGYILSKHVLAAATRMAAMRYAPTIRVNAVAPGLILPPPGEDEAYLQRLGKMLPLQRHGSAEDIVDAVMYLLAARFVTGQVIYVDGGRHLKESNDGPNPH